MKIFINGEEKKFQNPMTIEEILKDLKIKEMVMACAVNTEIVKKGDWKTFAPKDGDKVEFLEFVGGG